jgi:SsrA-binding protein
MKKLESSFKNMVIVLSGITLFAALALGSVYTFTKEPIAASKTAKQQNAIKEVLPPDFDHLAEPIVMEGEETLIVYKAYNAKGELIGAAVESSSNSGFSGRILVMVGFDKEGNIFNHQETRTRKLLLHKKEILKLRDKIELQGLTLVPLKLYFKKNKAKIYLALAKGKKTFDKRESIKEKDIKRDLEKSYKIR